MTRGWRDAFRRTTRLEPSGPLSLCTHVICAVWSVEWLYMWRCGVRQVYLSTGTGSNKENRKGLWWVAWYWQQMVVGICLKWVCCSTRNVDESFKKKILPSKARRRFFECKRYGDLNIPWRKAQLRQLCVQSQRVHCKFCAGADQLLESHWEFCEGVRARELTLLRASGDFGDSADFAFNCEARLYYGWLVDLVVLCPLRLVCTQLPILSYMFAQFFRQRFALCWSCKLIPLYMSFIVLPCSCMLFWKFSFACHRSTHPKNLNSAHILTCCLAFTGNSPSCEEPHFVLLVFVSRRSVWRREKLPDCEDELFVPFLLRCLRGSAQVVQRTNWSRSLSSSNWMLPRTTHWTDRDSLIDWAWFTQSQCELWIRWEKERPSLHQKNLAWCLSPQKNEMCPGASIHYDTLWMEKRSFDCLHSLLKAFFC